MIREFVMTEIKSVNTTASWHWRKRKMLVDLQKWSVKSVLEGKELPYPCKVDLVRHGSRLMDEDNLYASLKSIRDAIADKIKPGLRPGVADGDIGIEWTYSQAKCKRLNSGVLVTITAV